MRRNLRGPLRGLEKDDAGCDHPGTGDGLAAVAVLIYLGIQHPFDINATSLGNVVADILGLGTKGNHAMPDGSLNVPRNGRVEYVHGSGNVDRGSGSPVGEGGEDGVSSSKSEELSFAERFRHGRLRWRGAVGLVWTYHLTRMAG